MNYKYVLPFFACLLFSTFAFAGGIKGYINDNNGAPLPFAAIYIVETGSGTAANVEGYYELRLAPGKYTVVFQYLGYQPLQKKVTVGESFKQVDVALQPEALELKEVDVVGSREDPAYTVMRKAIAKASYHRQQVDRYEVEVYIKGSGRIKDSPFLLQNAMEKEGIDSTIAFTSESVSFLTYTRPNTYDERVISYKVTGDDNDLDPNSYIQGSFYEPEFEEAISPLSPRAFAYYKFKHEGFFMDRGYGINKIRVIPRNPGEDVFDGLIYIVEDEWSIHSLQLQTNKLGFEFNIEQSYAPIDGKAWLPVSQQFFIIGKFFGFLFEYQYLAAMSNYKVTLNPDLDVSFDVIDETVEAVPTKKGRDVVENQEINEKLASGEELTRKELRQLIKAYQKQERKAQEEPEVIENTSYTIDTMAAKRDSAYWEAIRPVPLTKMEVKGYRRADSIARVETHEQDSLERIGVNKGGGFNWLSLVGGGSYEVRDSHYFAHSAIWDKFFFNTVEGFNLHADFSYAISKANRFSITLTPRYAFARNKLTGKLNIGYEFGKDALARKRLYAEGGRYISQYNAQNPLSYLFNTYLNLAERRNYLRVYEKDYLKLSYTHPFKENWIVSGGLEWAERFHLQNNTDFSFNSTPNREYDTNDFVNREYLRDIPETEEAFILSLNLEARPWQKYRIKNGKKEPIRGTSPTLKVNYRQGIPDVLGSFTDYSFLQVGVEHLLQFGARGQLRLSADAGRFFNNTYVGFADFRHFMGNRVLLLPTKPSDRFRLLPYYEYSTTDEFAKAHVHYQFRKLAITQIPQVWLLGIKENVFVNYLATPTAEHYTEVGYSIDNIFRLFRVEVAASFQDGQYEDWGVFLGVSATLGGGTFSIE